MIYGVGEEKENRLMEILLSSVDTRQLLAGKVLGLGTTGLTQVGVWLISAALVGSVPASPVGALLRRFQAPTGLLVLSGIYFVLAYMLFAVLTAGIGAISPTARDGQQLISVLVFTMVAPIWFTGLLVTNPNHPASVALSLFPITASVCMVIRAGVADVPAWQLVLSLGLLLASTVGGLVAAAKLFRTYLLMYGRRPQLGEVLKTLGE